METVKQAISEGSLWELMEARSRGHPALASALRRLFRYRDALERGSPSYKGRGVLFFDHGGLARPEITRHLYRLEVQHLPSTSSNKLLLVSAPDGRPYNRTRQYSLLESALEEGLGGAAQDIQVCFYAAPFGVVPVELAETYPLSQFEVAEPVDRETLEFAAESVARYIARSKYGEVFIFAGTGALDELVEEKSREACLEGGKGLGVVSDPQPWGDEALGRLVAVLKGP